MSMAGAATCRPWWATSSAHYRTGQAAPGVSVSYTGQYEFLIRAKERMKLVIPVTLAIILGLCT
jgi:hypothetical protein